MDQTENQFRLLHESSRQALSISGQSQPHTCPADVATRRAAILLGCYRKGDAEDPETYSASVAAVLSTYPQEVAYRVTDPRTGLAGRSQWLPTVAEVRAACEAEMAPSRAQARREAQRSHTEAVVGRSSERPLSKDRWDDLRRQVATGADDHKGSVKPKQFTMTLMPLTISVELRAQIARFVNELNEAVNDG